MGRQKKPVITGVWRKTKDCELIFSLYLRKVPDMKLKLWHIPAAFFAVAAVLNFAGQTADSIQILASLTKPALMPLLAATTLAAARDRESKTLKLLIAAQLCGCAGDILLIPGDFLPFIGGLVMFLVGHIFYISIMGGLSWKGLGVAKWVVALLVMAALVAVLAMSIGVSGVMLAPMAIYGMVLMLLIFSALAGFLKYRTGVWGMLLCAAVLFTFSDILVASRSFDAIPFEGKGLVIMVTYLAAQSMLAAGILALQRK